MTARVAHAHTKALNNEKVMQTQLHKHAKDLPSLVNPTTNLWNTKPLGGMQAADSALPGKHDEMV